MMFDKLRCWVMGHKRVKRITYLDGMPVDKNTFQCPRCGTTWTRKARKATA